MSKPKTQLGWSDFCNITYESVSGSLGRQNVSSGFFYINNINFIDLHNSDDGGAIFSESESKKLIVVEKSSFIECSSEQNGGGIFVSQESEIVMSMNCANKCSIVGDNIEASSIFSRTRVTNSANSLHDYILCSCSHCGQLGKGHGTIHLSYGNQNILSLNISNSESRMYCGFFFDVPSYNTIYTKFCSLFGSNASFSSCIRLGGGVAIHNTFLNNNIISNSCQGNDSNFIEFTTQVQLLFCSIFNNYATKIFQNNGGSLVIDRCYIQHEYESLSGITLINTYSIFSSNIMTHLSLGSCYASIYNTFNVMNYASLIEGNLKCSPKHYYIMTFHFLVTLLLSHSLSSF